MASVGPGPILQSQEVPGQTIKLATAAIEGAAEALQSLAPVSRIHAHLCA
jgi:hypothetical protein